MSLLKFSTNPTLIVVLSITLIRQTILRNVDSLETMSSNIESFFRTYSLSNYSCFERLNDVEVKITDIKPIIQFEKKSVFYKGFKYCNVAISYYYSLVIRNIQDKEYLGVRRLKVPAELKIPELLFLLKDDNSLSLQTLFSNNITMEFSKIDVWNYQKYKHSFQEFTEKLEYCFKNFLWEFIASILDKYPLSDNEYNLYSMKGYILDKQYYDIPDSITKEIERCKIIDFTYEKKYEIFTNINLSLRVDEIKYMYFDINVTFEFLYFNKNMMKLGDITYISDKKELLESIKSTINYIFEREYKKISWDNYWN